MLFTPFDYLLCQLIFWVLSFERAFPSRLVVVFTELFTHHGAPMFLALVCVSLVVCMFHVFPTSWTAVKVIFRSGWLFISVDDLSSPPSAIGIEMRRFSSLENAFKSSFGHSFLAVLVVHQAFYYIRKNIVPFLLFIVHQFHASSHDARSFSCRRISLCQFLLGACQARDCGSGASF